MAPDSRRSESCGLGSRRPFSGARLSWEMPTTGMRSSLASSLSDLEMNDISWLRFSNRPLVLMSWM